MEIKFWQEWDDFGFGINICGVKYNRYKCCFSVQFMFWELWVYFIKESRGKCKVCGREFDELDMKLKNSRPDDVCASCFTSNA